ncbi:Zn-ribbon domain-containing OB-fold protein [Solimonas flava]|uniref:Zn-ribbon domain-containing OB-fold protein n=1 Tax=Solimonas flava TaxID=415849 RepID=UPI000480B1A3|nr:OB-fold domain-containing protein [Solimonas flava]
MNAPAVAAPMPVLDGWFTLDAERPQLLGNRCARCGTVYFPKLKSGYCRHPDCDGDAFDEVPLSRTGTLWSYTNAAYQPPEPFAQVDKDAYRPFAIAAVELAAEQMIVLGPVVDGVGVEQLKVGMTMALKLEALADGKLTWKWAPAGAMA